MNNKEMLHNAEVLTAKANGVECERQWQFKQTLPWEPWTNKTYDPIRYNYRIKPEPEPVVTEWWTNVTPHGPCGRYQTPEQARKCAPPNATEIAVKVVRADSIEIADLVTDEQIEIAYDATVGLIGLSPRERMRRFLNALGKVREDSNA